MNKTKMIIERIHFHGVLRLFATLMDCFSEYPHVTEFIFNACNIFFYSSLLIFPKISQKVLKRHPTDIGSS